MTTTEQETTVTAEALTPQQQVVPQHTSKELENLSRSIFGRASHHNLHLLLPFSLTLRIHWTENEVKRKKGMSHTLKILSRATKGKQQSPTERK